MENQEYNFNEEENKAIQEEEIPNIEQFQVERSGPHDGFDSDLAENSAAEPDPNDKEDDGDDSEYADDEVEFADGEGTLLSEEFDDEEDED